MATPDSRSKPPTETPSTPGAEKKTGDAAKATEGGHGLPVDDGTPIPVSDRQHVSGYGGKGAEPKASSDQREPQRPD